jgi:hypothetical protein
VRDLPDVAEGIANHGASIADARARDHDDGIADADLGRALADVLARGIEYGAEKRNEGGVSATTTRGVMV